MSTEPRLLRRREPHEHVAERRGSLTACMRCGEMPDHPMHTGGGKGCEHDHTLMGGECDCVVRGTAREHDEKPAKCDRTTVCVLHKGHKGACQRPGGVKVVTVAEREHEPGWKISPSVEHAEVLAKALDQFFADARGTPSVGDSAKLRQAVEPTLRALGYPKKET
jgi:hypothetical protein